MRRLLSTTQTAEKLGHKSSWLIKNREKLKSIGFPGPMPLPGIPLYDEQAIDAWLDTLQISAYNKAEQERKTLAQEQLSLEAHIAALLSSSL